MSLVSFRSVKLILSYLTTVCLLSLGKNTSNMKTCIALIVKYKHVSMFHLCGNIPIKIYIDIYSESFLVLMNNSIVRCYVRGSFLINLFR